MLRSIALHECVTPEFSSRHSREGITVSDTRILMPSFPRKRERRAYESLTNGIVSRERRACGRSRVEPVGQRADTVDDDADGAAWLHRSHAHRRAAGDDITRLQRHVLRDEAHQPDRLKDDVR